ncbi:hypothetical protein OF83DRAFT_912236 [Amylostereum chailletii]|nr:hypothetical protein OF83DRAFT_912236 [Amylostereum chailletii]
MDIDSPPACRRLPPEILLKIFVFLRGHTVPVSTRHDHADCMYPIVVTQVCREWRMVAFACEQLWTCEALCHGHEWTMRALELSGTSPLSVYVFPSSDKDKEGHHFEKTMEGATLLLGQLHRIEFLSVDLTLSGISESERGIITSLLCAQTAPRMKTLVLDYGYREWIEELPQDPELFAGITPPDIEELTIYLAIIPPTFHLFNAPLTCLILESCTIWRAMDPFLDTLSRLPTLETFSYIMDPVDRIGIESNTVSQARAARSVVMPNMRRFKLGDNIVSVGNIMPYLSLPSNASVTIMGACEDQPLYPQSPSIEQSIWGRCSRPHWFSWPQIRSSSNDLSATCDQSPLHASSLNQSKCRRISIRRSWLCSTFSCAFPFSSTRRKSVSYSARFSYRKVTGTRSPRSSPASTHSRSETPRRTDTSELWPRQRRGLFSRARR